MTEVACALIKRGDEFLITQRSEKMSHPLAWEFPGGKLFPGESPERGLKREIYEELKIRISGTRIRLVGLGFLPSLQLRTASAPSSRIMWIRKDIPGGLFQYRMSNAQPTTRAAIQRVDRFLTIPSSLNDIEL